MLSSCQLPPNKIREFPRCQSPSISLRRDEALSIRQPPARAFAVRIMARMFASGTSRGFISPVLNMYPPPGIAIFMILSVSPATCSAVPFINIWMGSRFPERQTFPRSSSLALPISIPGPTLTTLAPSWARSSIWDAVLRRCGGMSGRPPCGRPDDPRDRTQTA